MLCERMINFLGLIINYEFEREAWRMEPKSDYKNQR